ncbi:MAG: Hsp20/alpha crystallin family protein [Cyclobacteriaceae bacterium]|nr:Hsp20/alpha crystallin family protein [Cyclobacteriaceae bacterium]
MTLVKRDAGYAPALSNFFDDFFTRDLFNWPSSSATGTTIPSVNIYETDGDFHVEMAAPGMLKSDFKIELDNNVLTITSQKQSENRDEDNKNYQRKEFSFQSFFRTFHLPDSAEAEKINAKYEDGILRLVIPKKEEAKRKPIKTIKIS